MDKRYMPLIEYVVQRFSKHVGSRLQSVYVKGSVARGDAVWGISDLDLVLAFESPTAADTALKREVEAAALELPGGASLVIQRIGSDRLEQMDERTTAYWLYASWYDCEVVYGQHPSEFLPPPPSGRAIAQTVLSIVFEEGHDTLALISLDEMGCRLVAKRILQCWSMLLVYQGYADYVPLQEVQQYPLPTKLQEYASWVMDAFLHPRSLPDATQLRDAWQHTWAYIHNHHILNDV